MAVVGDLDDGSVTGGQTGGPGRDSAGSDPSAGEPTGEAPAGSVGAAVWLPRALCGLLLAALLVAVDQWTKYVAEAELADGRRIELVGDLFGLRLAYNTGAAFSLFTGATLALTVIATVASVVLVVAIVRTHHLGWALSLGLLLGGAVGNLVDRLLRDPGPGRGAVVDFFAVPNFPVFNVADCAVVCGAALIVLASARGTPYRRGRATAT